MVDCDSAARITVEAGTEGEAGWARRASSRSARTRRRMRARGSSAVARPRSERAFTISISAFSV